jgi:hypothetical protein
MRIVFRRSLNACLSATLLLVCAASAGAQQTGVPKRPQGPVAGPVIRLPAGQGETLGEQAETPAPGEPARSSAPAPRWEYCAIMNTATIQKDRWSPIIGAANVRYFGGAGHEQIEGVNEDEALANAMAKLGEDGWELVAVTEPLSLMDGTGGSRTRFFFKRPKTPARQQ